MLLPKLKAPRPPADQPPRALLPMRNDAFPTPPSPINTALSSCIKRGGFRRDERGLFWNCKGRESLNERERRRKETQEDKTDRRGERQTEGETIEAGGRRERKTQKKINRERHRRRNESRGTFGKLNERKVNGEQRRKGFLKQREEKYKRTNTARDRRFLAHLLLPPAAAPQHHWKKKQQQHLCKEKKN